MNRQRFLYGFIGIILGVITPTVDGADQQMLLSVSAQKHAKVPLTIALVTPVSSEVDAMAPILVHDLAFSGQFAVAHESVPAYTTKQELHAFLRKKDGLVLFITSFKLSDGGSGFEWRLYDTTQMCMVQGKRYAKRDIYPRSWAHGIVDMVWPVMTGQPGFFSSKIAFCRAKRIAGKKKVQHIYIADYDGSHAQPYITTSTVNVAPRWNYDAKRPLLFYSEYTNNNIRLMAADMRGRKKIVSNFDGINMVPSFTRDGKKVTYCASRGDGTCHIYVYDARGLHKITHNYGNNVSPIFGRDGETVYYCSDAQTGLPQLFQHKLSTQESQRITTGGYCASPSYSYVKRKLAYTKRIDGVMQIVVYDPATGEQEQVTHNQGNKEEVSWSPCGNYLLFSVASGGTNRIALFDLSTRASRFVTPAKQECSYPAWSPLYDTYPWCAGVKGAKS